MQNSVIQVRSVRRVYRSPKKSIGWNGAWRQLIAPDKSEKVAVDGISFNIREGEFVGLIGQNGAGKTTLLKMLSGLIPPSAGEISVLGEDPFTRSLGFRRQIALVMGQKAQLWWDLPAVDAFDLVRVVYQIPREIAADRVKKLTELLSVESLLTTQIRKLSLGERMKMELIGALLHYPKIVYLDEPTIGLDIIAAKRLRGFLKTYNEQENATIILTSHNIDDIEQLCSRLLILKDGLLIYDGLPENLGVQENVRLVTSWRSRDNNHDVGFSVLSEKWAAKEIAKENTMLTLEFSVPRAQIASLLGEFSSVGELIDIRIEETSLEDTIERIFEGSRLDEPATNRGVSR